MGISTLEPTTVQTLPLLTEEIGFTQRTESVANPAIENLALSILRLGMRKEASTSKTLNKLAEEARTAQQTMRELIDLNGKLFSSTDNKKGMDLSDEMMPQIASLHAQGIHLLDPNERHLSHERLAHLKNQVVSQIDRLKLEVQKTFTTEIQVATHILQAVQDFTKSTERTESRLMDHLAERQRV